MEDNKKEFQGIHASERDYFDHKALEEGRELVEEEWRIDPAEYRATLKLWGLDGNLGGTKVLECACGTGFFSVLLARMGAEVCCFDLSPGCVELAERRAALNGVGNRVRASVAAFEELDYEDEAFDLIVGKNVLHHIPDIRQAGHQVHRLLKSGGKAIFYELSAGNPILMLFRDHVIGRSRLAPKLGTPDEHPLTAQEVQTLTNIFEGRCRVSYPKFRFFGKLDRQVFQQRYRSVSFALELLDRMVYVCFPPLRKYSYKILLELTK